MSVLPWKCPFGCPHAKDRAGAATRPPERAEPHEYENERVDRILRSVGVMQVVDGYKLEPIANADLMRRIVRAALEDAAPPERAEPVALTREQREAIAEAADYIDPTLGHGQVLSHSLAATLRSILAAPPADEARDALRELVACKDLNERARSINPLEPGCEREVLMDEWRKREPRAWERARAAIAGKDTANPACYACGNVKCICGLDQDA